ncbi:MAG TPA: cupin domain-containing protein [Gaiellales bacterium]|jgi:quercetin dioxygenase-like cupin family protein|nr:cupin domain-containing protein [Gaiellales bacterium]
MRIVQRGEVSESYGGRFTGRVELEMLQPAEAEGLPDVARVHFYEGAVTNWHSHPGGQHLYLLEGLGRVGMPDAVHELKPGAYVVAPPGERHYHGAARGSNAVWLTITWGVTAWEGTPEGV